MKKPRTKSKTAQVPQKLYHDIAEQATAQEFALQAVRLTGNRADAQNILQQAADSLSSDRPARQFLPFSTTDGETAIDL